jgi:hypothetical protein
MRNQVPQPVALSEVPFMPDALRLVRANMALPANCRSRILAQVEQKARP